MFVVPANYTHYTTVTKWNSPEKEVYGMYLGLVAIELENNIVPYKAHWSIFLITYIYLLNIYTTFHKTVA